MQSGLEDAIAATVYPGRRGLKSKKHGRRGVYGAELGPPRAPRAARLACRRFVHRSALGLAACNPDSQGVSAQQPRGATVAFDSLDGLPPGQFQRLVENLNEEAQSRRLPVISREQPSAYRVRGYLAAKVAKNQTTISWVWDVFDQDEHRALRISGEETAKVRHKDAWAAADDALLQRIAQSSMEQLTAFLTSPAVAPGTAPSCGGSNCPRRRKRIPPRGRRYFPYFPPAGRSSIDGERRAVRRGCDGPRAASAAAPRGACIVARDVDARGVPPLSRDSSFPPKAGTTISSRIAAPCPPCYDHAACGRE